MSDYDKPRPVGGPSVIAMALPRDPASLYDRKNTPLTAVVDAVPADAWSHASPCEGWTTADVLQHMVDTQRDFLLKAGAEMPDPTPSVARDGATAWRTHAEAVARNLADPTIGEQPHETPFGASTVGQVLSDFYGFDMLVHRWDVATAAGIDAGLTDAELDEIEAAADGFGEHLTDDGVCHPPVEPPQGADRTTRVMARLGRAL